MGVLEAARRRSESQRKVLEEGGEGGTRGMVKESEAAVPWPGKGPVQRSGKGRREEFKHARTKRSKMQRRWRQRMFWGRPCGKPTWIRRRGGHRDPLISWARFRHARPRGKCMLAKEGILTCKGVTIPWYVASAAKRFNSL